ncbi:hypothetical protein F7O44_10565 [Phytoactinopolyspora sp. XMNu-373]|uniref:Uncharacterized protein n=1 Tax=Phytoactinopolyspora mesophila TaxID=2650750 RepID=A0A7K3M2K8_9ACTN|nr:hypothetical protein [Phytoactinopolyspora mesophila]
MSPVSRLTWILRKVLSTIGGRTLAMLIVLILAYQVWIGVTAMSKVADGVGEELDRRGTFTVDVVLGFPPERFHMLELQAYGRVQGTTDNVLHLRNVTQEDVDAMARKYWIKEIRPGRSLR